MKIINSVGHKEIINRYNNYGALYNLSKKIQKQLRVCGFNNIGNSSYVTNIGDNTVTIANGAHPIINSTDKNIVLPNADLTMVSYDYSYSTSNTSRKINSTLINICYNNYIIGNYNVEQNILILCSLANNTLDNLFKILCYIEKFNNDNNIDRKFKPYKYNKCNRITIGMDPEFMLINKKDMTTVRACDHIADPNCKAEVGLDGAMSIGELRPTAACSPKVLVNNIKKLYTKLNKIIKHKDLLVYTGSGKEFENALGGHIHIGGIKPDKNIIGMLDDFIGIPIKSLKNSDRASYGRLGSYEEKSYGFEYRTPPSFIGNKEFTEGVLSVALCIANTYRRRKSFTYNDIPKEEDYYNLEGAEKYKASIDYFIDFTNKPTNTLSQYDTLAAWEIIR